MKVYLRKEFVRSRLIRRNVSQNWLATLAGVTSGYMSQLMDGSRCPSPKLRQRLMEVFPDYKFDDLFRIKERG